MTNTEVIKYMVNELKNDVNQCCHAGLNCLQDVFHGLLWIIRDDHNRETNYLINQ